MPSDKPIEDCIVPIAIDHSIVPKSTTGKPVPKYAMSVRRDEDANEEFRPAQPPLTLPPANPSGEEATLDEPTPDATMPEEYDAASLSPAEDDAASLSPAEDDAASFSPAEDDAASLSPVEEDAASLSPTEDDAASLSSAESLMPIGHPVSSLGAATDASYYNITIHLQHPDMHMVELDLVPGFSNLPADGYVSQLPKLFNWIVYWKCPLHTRKGFENRHTWEDFRKLWETCLDQVMNMFTVPTSAARLQYATEKLIYVVYLQECFGKDAAFPGANMKLWDDAERDGTLALLPCDNCRKIGHNWFACPSRCRSCNGRGHWAPNCLDGCHIQNDAVMVYAHGSHILLPTGAVGKGIKYLQTDRRSWCPDQDLLWSAAKFKGEKYTQLVLCRGTSRVGW